MRIYSRIIVSKYKTYSNSWEIKTIKYKIIESKYKNYNNNWKIKTIKT